MSPSAAREIETLSKYVFHPPQDGWEWDFSLQTALAEDGAWLVVRRYRGLGRDLQSRSERAWWSQPRRWGDPHDMMKDLERLLDGIVSRFAPPPIFRIGTRSKKRLQPRAA